QALQGIEKIISVECNGKGQLVTLVQQHGFKVDDQILKYDGRPFSLEDLENDVKKVIG
ncbi:MAG TPA: pyruvate ferredoxin oxidoreductase, partial [Peptococcaceae bacterium]|nr:pyruvate ferredoxin oxidoreductase [Peptococcaceae bacterium]